jgi:conjugative transfer pilus assembly protein TraH
MKTKNHKNKVSLSMTNIKKVEKMRNMSATYFRKVVKTLLFSILATTAMTSHSGWMDDWVDQSTSSGPDYFKGQQRGYFSGGSYSMRYRNKKDYLFSIQKPRLKTGCGGIDLFMGGFSFLDPEYLMQKMQRALQAAPAIAFDLALKEVMAEGAASLGKFEGIINMLNSLQMSECELGKEIAITTGMDKGFGEIMGVANADARESNSATKGWFNTSQDVKSNNNKPTEDQNKLIEGCSSEFKSIFTENGSVLEHIAKTKGLEQYAPYMRAYLGDVVINYSDKQYGSKSIEACADISPENVDDILTGEAQIRSVTGDCTQATDKGLLQEVDILMNSIANKISSRNGGFSISEQGFISSMPYAIFNSLVFAVQHNTVDMAISTLREPAARAMAFAMVDDLISKIYELTRIANAGADNANNGVSDKLCQPATVAPIVASMRALKERAYTMNLAIKKARTDSLSGYVDSLEFNRNIERQIKKFSNRDNRRSTH